MVDQVYISKFDESYLRIRADRSILMELSDRFSYTVPNASFLPSVRNNYWDGKIRLLDLRSGKMYLGLHTHVAEFCEENGYECIYEDSLDIETAFSVDEFKRMVASLKLSVTNDVGERVNITPHDYQEQGIIHAIQAGRSLLLSPTACHSPGTEVVMYDGSFRKIEDVRVGDCLMGPDSTPRNVLRLHHGFDEMYRVVPHSGEPFECNGNHVLSLVQTNEGKQYAPKAGTIVNITLNNFVKTSKYFKHVHKLYHSDAVDFGMPNSSLPIEPYFLGLLLGDGSLTSAIGVSSADIEIVDELYKQAEIFGLTIRVCEKPDNKAKDYYFTGSHTTTSTHINWLSRALDEINIRGVDSESKHIPHMYKVAPIKQRLQLLAGLIDTDGHLSNATAFEYVTKSPQLRDDVAFISRSLGFFVSITPKIVNETTYYRLFISGEIERVPVRLPRKKKVLKTRKNPLVSGFKIETLGIQEYFGFELSGDHLYLLRDFTVTHNSGKSLMIYILMRYYLAVTKGKVLIIVPTTNLVQQLYEDFADYSGLIAWDIESNCHTIYDGGEKLTDKRVVISTWQALAMKERLPEEIRSELTKAQIKMWNKKAPCLLDDEYFAEFETIFGDECHLFAAEDSQGGGELMGIMSKLCNAQYRIGTTGSLKDSKVHHLILEGIFGKVYQTITTREMMDTKRAADLSIKCLQLKYPDEECKMMRRKTYQEEIDFLITHTSRNNFIRNLALSLNGNTLILFERVERHGKLLYKMIESEVANGRKVFFVAGETPTDERNMVRKITETETDAIIVASYGTFSTGVSIRNIDNMIFASSTKSKIRVLQSIGRGLRLSTRKTRVTLFDITDDLSCWNKAGTQVQDNYSLQHFTERVNFYNTEQFDYKMYKIQLEASNIYALD